MRCLIVFLCPVMLVLTPLKAAADAFVPSTAMHGSTIAEVVIEGAMIHTELEIGLEDLPVFADLLPDAALAQLGRPPEPKAKRFARFLSEVWVFETAAGPLSGRIVSVAPRPRVVRDSVTGAPLEAQPADREVTVHAVLEHDLPASVERIAIRPPLTEAGKSTADIGLSVRHEDVTVNDFRFLAEPEALVLDRSNPWYSRFDNRVFWRHARNGMAAYVAIAPFEIRKEVVLRLLDVAPELGLSVPDRGEIAPEIRGRILDAIAAGLAERLPVTVDGTPVTMQLDRIEFLDRNLRRSEPLQEDSPLPAQTATIGAIYTLPVEARPETVALHWDLFSNRIRSVPGIFTDEAAGPPWNATPDDPVLHWQNLLVADAAQEVEPVPVESAGWRLLPAIFGQAEAAPMTEEALASKLETLLANLHLIQQMTLPDQIDENLGATVAGRAREDLEIEFETGLAVTIAGGGTARIDRIELTDLRDIQPLAGRGYSATVEWTGRARAGHWGHAHRRDIAFTALLDVVPEDGFWRVAGLTVIEKREVE